MEETYSCSPTDAACRIASHSATRGPRKSVRVVAAAEGRMRRSGGRSTLCRADGDYLEQSPPSPRCCKLAAGGKRASCGCVAM